MMKNLRKKAAQAPDHRRCVALIHSLASLFYGSRNNSHIACLFLCRPWFHKDTVLIGDLLLVYHITARRQERGRIFKRNHEVESLLRGVAKSSFPIGIAEQRCLRVSFHVGETSKSPPIFPHDAFIDGVGSLLVPKASLHEKVEDATMNRSAVAGFGPSTEIGVEVKEGSHDIGIMSVIDVGADFSAFVLR